MTETLITHLPAPGSVRPGYVGCAIPGVEAKLGEDQELLMRSPMNMLGYYKDPEGTRACFTADGFFRTGDLARIDPDGQLKIVGRVKEQFKTSKGKYVMPAPIESQLLAHPVVEACCLMGAGMPHPFAVVLLAEETRKLRRSRRAGGRGTDSAGPDEHGQHPVGSARAAQLRGRGQGPGRSATGSSRRRLRSSATFWRAAISPAWMIG